MAVEKILVPIDFSEHSWKALEFAADLARSLNGSVTLLHVYYVAPDPGGAKKDWTERSLRILEGVEEAMRGARIRAANLGLAVETLQVAGELVDAIVYEASRGDFDLVVMGTHGRAGFKRIALGSVAEGVVRRAPCPVVTVRLHEEAKPRRS